MKIENWKLKVNPLLIFLPGSFLFLLWLVPVPVDKVAFLDVGQGDAILLQDGSVQVLVDGGPGREVVRRLGEEMPWFDRRIAVVVVTHPQKDHLEGLMAVMERYDVGMVLLPKAVSSSSLQEAWLDELIERQVPYRFAWAGQEISAGDIQLQVLAPFYEEGMEYIDEEDMNDASIVLRTDFDEMSFLLTGDAEKKTERGLAARYGNVGLLDVVVLKAGHHGSKTSTSAELLEAATPGAVVISAGKDNQYGHPHADVLGRLSGLPVWRTDRDGTVRFVRYDGKWLVKAAKNEQI